MRKVACRLTLAAVSLALSLHLTSTRGNAAPFVYSESVFGDLPSVLPAPTVFAFDLGTNVVSGQKSFPDTDSFAFSVPAGTELVSISLAFASTDFMLSSALPSTTATRRVRDAVFS
jgi:hypothetical protein